VLVVESTARSNASAEQTSAALVALGTDGRTLWRRPVGTGYWDASLWGSSVVAQGPDPNGGPQLRAFDATSGTPTWRIGSGQAPPHGRHPRPNFGEAVQVDDRFVVPSPNGLLDVDPATGSFHRLDSDVAIEQVLPVADHAVVRTAGALLVVGLTS
jgi:outer membrane protein assembly factor BamB